MEYINVNGIKLSKFTLGTVQLGLNYGIANRSGKPDKSEAYRILKLAVSKGINSFDTASLYGDSEDILGSFFSTEKGTNIEPVITTKFKIDPDEGNVEKQIYRNVESSLKKLNINKIPVYMLHNAADMSSYGSIVNDTLKKIQNDGLINKLGVSVYDPEQASEMLDLGIYEAIQFPMNIFDQRMITSTMLDKLKERRIIVFVRSVYLQGLFFLDPLNLPQKLKKAKTPLLKLYELSQKEHLSIQQLAIAFARDLEGVSSLVIGVETSKQLEDNIEIMNCPKLKENTRESIRSIFGSVPIGDIMKGLR